MFLMLNNMRIERYIVALAALGFAVAVKAQDLDPTVTVTRQYQGKLVEVTKPEVNVTIPDSLRTFDLNIDYSIFDNPYKGAYEFNPYLMDIKPQADGFYGNEFYVRAGAGYALCPTVDVIWTPRTPGRFKMSLYASHESHIGEYRNVASYNVAGRNWLMYNDGDGKWKGYDLMTTAGMNGRIDWNEGLFSFDLGYYGIHTQSNMALAPFQRGYNAADVGFRVASKENSASQFVYDFSARYRFAHEASADRLPVSYPGPEVGGRHHAVSHGLELDFSLGKKLNEYSRFIVGLDGSMEALTGFYDYASVVGITPKYVYNRGRFDLSAGVVLALPFMGNPGGYEKNYGQVVYPEVVINFELVEDFLNVYVEADGGPELHSYADMLASEHFFSPLFASGNGRFIDAEIKNYGAKFGIEGRISKFFYDLSFGYDDYSAKPFYSHITGSVLPVLVYEKASGMGLDARLGWEDEFVDVEGHFGWNKMNVPAYVYAPAEFEADLRARFNWRRRIFASLSGEFSSARHSDALSLPYYLDLGVGLEYRATRNLSVWLKGGNLLNQTIQRTPVYVEPGINFTAGICLDF